MAQITSRGPGRPRSQAADDSIRQAALELLDGGGYRALTIEGVAALAGVGKATVYRRYRSKHELLRDLVERFRELDLPIPDSGSVREDLRLIVSNGVQVLTTSVWGRALPALVAEQTADPELMDVARTFWRSRKEAVAVVIDRGIARGELRADLDRDLAFDLVVSPMYFRYLVSSDDLPEDLSSRIVDEVMIGIGPDRA